MALDKITVRQIPNGPDGTRETLKLMATLAKRGKVSPPVYAKARELVAHLPPKDWRGQVDAIYTFVRDAVRYVSDVDGMEGLQTPDVTLEILAGDCDDKVILLGALLTSIGHPVQFCAVKVDDEKDFSHVAARTLMGTAWVWLETTEGPLPMGDGGPNFHRIVQPMMVVTVR